MACSMVIRAHRPVLDGRLLRCATAPRLALPCWASAGSRTAPVVSTLTVLACPVSMMLVLWRMRTGVGASHPPRTVHIGIARGQYGTSNTAVNRHEERMTTGEHRTRRRSHARTAIAALSTASR